MDVGCKVQVRNHFVHQDSKEYGKPIVGVVVATTSKQMSVCTEEEYKAAKKDGRVPNYIVYARENVKEL